MTPKRLDDYNNNYSSSNRRNEKTPIIDINTLPKAIFSVNIVNSSESRIKINKIQ